MILSNTTLNGVTDHVRENALHSFEFYANTVLSSGLPEDLCQAVQDLVEEREDVFVVTQRPRALAIAIHGWLAAQGVAVLTTAELPRTQVVQWLNLDVPGKTSDAVTLDVEPGGVRVQWV